MNELFVLHSFMTFDNNDDVLFHLKDRNSHERFVMKVVRCDDKDSRDDLERDVTFHYMFELHNLALPLVSLGQTKSDFVLINDNIGLAFTVTKHFDELIERVTTFFDNYSTIFNQFMDCVISLHECRVFTSHPSLT